MKRSDLPISEMSLPKKLDLLEITWEDLSRHEHALDSPAWHGSILKHRETALIDGKVTFSDWEKAKERIRRKVSIV